MCSEMFRNKRCVRKFDRSRLVVPIDWWKLCEIYEFSCSFTVVVWCFFGLVWSAILQKNRLSSLTMACEKRFVSRILVELEVMNSLGGRWKFAQRKSDLSVKKKVNNVSEEQNNRWASCCRHVETCNGSWKNDILKWRTKKQRFWTSLRSCAKKKSVTSYEIFDK